MVNVDKNFLIMQNNLLQMQKKRAIQKTAKATGYLIGSKIADKITRVSKKSRQNNSETVTNVREKKIYSQRETKNY